MIQRLLAPSRFSWQRQLEIHVPGRGSTITKHLATAREISEVGIRFFCREEIGLFTQIEVSLAGETASVPLIVRHCTVSKYYGTGTVDRFLMLATPNGGSVASLIHVEPRESSEDEMNGAHK